MKQRADGRYCKTVTVNGQRHFIYGDSPEEVEDKYIDLKYNQKKGMVLNDKTTLGELATEWYDTYIRDSKSQKTQDLYKSIINTHIAEFAHFKLKEIKPLMIDKYIKKLDKSKSLEHKIRITFNQIFKLAKANRLIDDNPMEYVKPVAQDDPKREFLSEANRNIVLKALEGHRGYLLVYTILNTGMREGEALALTWNDFDDKNSIINVDKAVEWVGGKPEVKEPKTKSGIRQIPIPDNLRDALLYEKEHRKRISKFIFTHQNGGMHTETSASNLWRKTKARVTKYIKDNVIADGKGLLKLNLTFRMLRHTYATALYDAGIDIKSAQEILGHSDFKITMNIYTHIQTERREKNVIKIQDLYNKKKLEKAAESS